MGKIGVRPVTDPTCGKIQTAFGVNVLPISFQGMFLCDLGRICGSETGSADEGLKGNT
jgi:hypothetical protein